MTHFPPVMHAILGVAFAAGAVLVALGLWCKIDSPEVRHKGHVLSGHCEPMCWRCDARRRHRAPPDEVYIEQMRADEPRRSARG